MPDFALIFDMDGVIVDSNATHKRALVQFCRSKGFELSEEDLVRRIYGRTNKDWITNLFGELPAERLSAYADEKEALYREMYAGSIEPLDGLLPFLEEMDKGGFKRAIGTSAPPENVTFTFEHTGVQRFFETVLDSTFISIGKPHPEIYLKCAEALGMEPSKCVVFEDSISGVKAGVAAGSPVVGITTTHTDAELKEAGAAFTRKDFTEMTFEDLAVLFA